MTHAKQAPIPSNAGRRFAQPDQGWRFVRATVTRTRYTINAAARTTPAAGLADNVSVDQHGQTTLTVTPTEVVTDAAPLTPGYSTS